MMVMEPNHRMIELRLTIAVYRLAPAVMGDGPPLPDSEGSTSSTASMSSWAPCP
jgi:hypothetical protein